MPPVIKSLSESVRQADCRHFAPQSQKVLVPSASLTILDALLRHGCAKQLNRPGIAGGRLV